MATRAEFQKNFSDFLEAARIHFGFLKRDFGFLEEPPSYGGYECNIEFRRADIRIDMGYELTSLPFCHFCIKVDDKWKTISTNQLLERAALSLGPIQIKAIKSDLKKDMDSALVAYSKMIRAYLTQSGNTPGLVI